MLTCKQMCIKVHLDLIRTYDTKNDDCKQDPIVCVCYLCYDRQNAHHSNKNSNGGGGEINDLGEHIEMIIMVVLLSGAGVIDYRKYVSVNTWCER